MLLYVGTVNTAADRPQNVQLCRGGKQEVLFTYTDLTLPAPGRGRIYPPILLVGQLRLQKEERLGHSPVAGTLRLEPLPHHSPCLDCPIPLCFRPQPVGADDASQPRGCGEERPSHEAGWETGDAVGRRDRSRLPAQYRIVPGSWAPFTLRFSQNPLFFILLCP